jgi:predicted MFS family arabinose efflux permease
MSLHSERTLEQASVRYRFLIVGCAMMYSVGSVVGWISPQILFGAAAQYSLAATQAGLPALVEFLTTGLLSMALGAFLPRVSYRHLGIAGIALFVIANAICPWAPDFSTLLVLRFFSGVANAILVFAAVSLVAARSANPDQAYAFMNIAANVYGAVVLALLPLLSPQSQGLMYVPFVAVLSLLLAPLLVFVPSDVKVARVAMEAIEGKRESTASPSRGAAVFIVLLALMVPLYFQTFAIFAYGVEIGSRLGMSEARINTTLAVAALASNIGPFVVAAASRCFGRWPPLFVAACIVFASNYVMTHADSERLFQICTVINLAGVYFFLPLLLGWSAELSPSGRYGSIVIGMLTIMIAVVPSAAGVFIDADGLAVLRPMVAVTGTAYVCLLLLLRVVSAATPPRAVVAGTNS